MYVPKKITIDLNKPRKEVVHLGQGDSFTRWIELTLLCDGVPYDPTADLSALGIQDGSDADIIKTVKYIKANGIPGEYEKIPENGTTPAVALMDGETNVYIVRLDEHATDVPGFAEVFVTFYAEDSDGNIHVLHSFPITIDVVQNTTNATDPGQPYYNGTPFLLKSKQATKTSAMTQPVGADDDGKLWTKPGGGGGGSDLPELHIGDLGKVLMAVDSGEDDPEWGVAFVTEVTATITQSGSTYSVPVGTFTTLSNAISNERYVAVFAPEGKAQFAGVEGTALTFVLFQDIGDVMTAVEYKISTSNSVTRTAWPIDNAAITPASIGAAVAVTVTTITDSSYQLAPVANYAYVFSNPVLSLEVTSSYAATGDWSIEFDAPTNVAPSVTLPSALKTIPASPTFSANHHYEINCHNGHAVVAEW